MFYNGKKVFTKAEFDYSKVQIGDYVEEAVVDEAINRMIPVCMRAGCTQMGGEYSMRFDEKTGKWRSTHLTFKRIAGEYPNGIWEFCGDCFREENEQRGKVHPCLGKIS